MPIRKGTTSNNNKNNDNKCHHQSTLSQNTAVPGCTCLQCRQNRKGRGQRFLLTKPVPKTINRESRWRWRDPGWGEWGEVGGSGVGGGGGRFDTLPTAHISREKVGSCDALTGFRLCHNHPPSHSTRGTTAHVHFSHGHLMQAGWSHF